MKIVLSAALAPMFFMIWFSGRHVTEKWKSKNYLFVAFYICLIVIALVDIGLLIAG